MSASPVEQEEIAEPEALVVRAEDGYALRASWWRHEATSATAAPGRPVVIINAATSVRRRYYARFAAYLFQGGFDVLTYDYRGIGDSRPPSLRGFAASWIDWGRLDCEAVIRHVAGALPGQPIHVVAHSIGGFVLGFAPSNHVVRRVFSMGAQIAYWRDHPAEQRARLFAKWHVVMPLVTALLGYFPGRRLRWLEDTPRGVVRDWRRFGSKVLGDSERRSLTRSFEAVTAPTLALSVTDDEFGTEPAIERLLAYYPNSPSTHLRIAPQSVGETSIGHFGFFNDRFEQTLWPIALDWLRSGKVPVMRPSSSVPNR